MRADIAGQLEIRQTERVLFLHRDDRGKGNAFLESKKLTGAMPQLSNRQIFHDHRGQIDDFLRHHEAYNATAAAASKETDDEKSADQQDAPGDKLGVALHHTLLLLSRHQHPDHGAAMTRRIFDDATHDKALPGPHTQAPDAAFSRDGPRPTRHHPLLRRSTKADRYCQQSIQRYTAVLALFLEAAALTPSWSSKSRAGTKGIRQWPQRRSRRTCRSTRHRFQKRAAPPAHTPAGV